MSRHLRTVAATVVTCLATSLVAAASADARWQRFASPSAGLSASTTTPSPAEALKLARRTFRGEGRGTDLTPLLRQLAIQLPTLRGSQRRAAQSLLARPTDGAADPQDSGYTVPEQLPFCSAHYCVHYVATTEDAPSLVDGNANGIPDYVEAVSAVAEEVHGFENDQLQWRLPESDGTLGGDSDKIDVYLKQLGGTGIYGYSAPDPSQNISTSDHSVFAYLVIDNDFQKSEFPSYDSPLTPLQVTLAHEYNHVIQFTYDVLEDTWFLESTAVWMEGKVYPAALDYLQYLPGWTELTALPLTTFNGTDPNDRRNVKVYGSAVWNKFLDARFGQTVVRGAWEQSLSTSPPSFAVDAYNRSIRALDGGGFATQFDRFAAATAEWQAANSGFPDGSLYPDVPRAGMVSVNGAGGTVKLNHTTYALVGVRTTNADRIKLGMTAPAGTSAALALVGREGGSTGGTLTVTVRDLPKGGAGSVTLTDPSRFSRLTAVLVNADSKVRSNASELTGDFIFKRDNQSFYARVSTDFTGPRVSRSSPRALAKRVSRNANVKITFSEPVLGVDRKSFRLLSPSGGTVGAVVRFKPGSRVATLVPDAALGRGRRYRVLVSRAVTDTAVNPLAKTTTFSFVTAK
jgi:hypothetical protein